MEWACARRCFAQESSGTTLASSVAAHCAVRQRQHDALDAAAHGQDAADGAGAGKAQLMVAVGVQRGQGEPGWYGTRSSARSPRWRPRLPRAAALVLLRQPLVLRQRPARLTAAAVSCAASR